MCSKVLVLASPTVDMAEALEIAVGSTVSFQPRKRRRKDSLDGDPHIDWVS